ERGTNGTVAATVVNAPTSAAVRVLVIESLFRGAIWVTKCGLVYVCRQKNQRVFTSRYLFDRIRNIR
ncbi:hypothetical protein ACFQ1S_07015, partial [Kibdelosporangium lantanae]